MKRVAQKNNLHIRFHPVNARHQQAAEYIQSVPHKQKTAFITAAIEAYRQLHPHGVDYQELKEIQRATWTGFLPKVPIMQSLKAKSLSAIDPGQGVSAPPPAPPPISPTGSKAIDESIDFYNLTGDDD